MDSVKHLEQIDAQRALDLLEKAVAERGEEYVYQPVWFPGRSELSCVYVDQDEQPSCIVGMALTLHGIPAETLARVNDFAADCLPTEWVTTEAAYILRHAQRLQDRGLAWGAAVRNARSGERW